MLNREAAQLGVSTLSRIKGDYGYMREGTPVNDGGAWRPTCLDSDGLPLEVQILVIRTGRYENGISVSRLLDCGLYSWAISRHIDDLLGG